MPITASSLRPAQPLEKGVPEPTQKPNGKSRFSLWGEDGFTFGDLLDVINPLQHIPVVSTIYRALTGDSLAPAPRLLGDTLFGGPIGAATSAANILVEHFTGKDAGAHMLALLDIPTQFETPTTAVAKVESVPPSAVPPLQGEQIGSLTRAAKQVRQVAALDAYTRGHKYLAVPAPEKRINALF
jgi:hypothetical protein